MIKKFLALVFTLILCLTILTPINCGLISQASEINNAGDTDIPSILAYSSAPDHLFPFIYRGSNPCASFTIDRESASRHGCGFSAQIPQKPDCMQDLWIRFPDRSFGP